MVTGLGIKVAQEVTLCSTAFLQVEVLITHNSLFFLSVMNPSSSLLFPVPLCHPCPAEGERAAPEEQSNVTKCAWHRSLYHILSISWRVLWKQEISKNTGCFVCWTGLQTTNTTKFTVREFLMKSLLLFVPYNMVCYCWGGILSAN